MNWIDFIVQMTGNLAWPCTVVFALWFLRDKFGALILRLESFKHKDTEIAFSKVADNVVEKAENIDVISRELSLDLKTEYERLKRFINMTPRAVVEHAYNILDRELLDIFINAATNDKPLNVKDGIMILMSYGVPKDMIKDIQELRKLRDISWSRSETSLTKNQVNSYLDLALDLTSRVREIKTNKSLNPDAQK